MTRPDAREVARLLRQRQEMGAPALILEEGTRAALLADAAALAARERGAVGPSARADAVARPRRPTAHRAPVPKPPGPAARAWADGAGPVEGPAVPSALPTLPAAYEDVRTAALACTRCGLSATRKQVVFSDGPADARVMVVGEAPGANEDATGLPFVGAAGKLLDLLLMSIDLSRAEQVYICNVLKCRPPGNRNPLPDEIGACSPFLRRQIELVRPEVILGVGSFAAQFLTGKSLALGKLRGEVYSYEGVPAVVTYHPAALLRNAGWTRATWDDLQLLRRVLDEG